MTMELSALLESLKKDVSYYNDPIREVLEEVIENNISGYPVFIAHQNNISLGEPILNRDDFGRDWSVSVTTLEDLVEANIIDTEWVHEFKKVYKNHHNEFCMLMVGDFGANFVFIPIHQKKTIKKK
jgi:hypothetical protein